MDYCLVLRLGRVDYGQALNLQRGLAQARMEGAVGDILLLLEHPPTITIGRRGNKGHLLADSATLEKLGVGLYQVERGGDITYHGPGQVVGYPILDLTRHGSDLHLYLRNLEEVIILTMSDFGIAAGRRPGLTGVWTREGKIASIGVHVRRWISWHGFALNVNTDLSHFDLTVPCGLQGVKVTSMASILRGEVAMEDVMERLSHNFSQAFGVEIKESSLDDLRGLIDE